VIDSHAHLDACADRPSALIRRARAAGVDRIVTVGTGIESSRAALELAQLHEEVFAALGIDPHQAGDAEAGRVEELRELLEHDEAVAVGETGLDYFRDRAPRDRQRKLFEAQLEVATELGKPVVIHTRDAEADTADVLSGFAGIVVMHCFSSPGLLDTVLDRGYYVSFAGNVTYPKAGDLRAAAAQVPAERILAETDSPYLAPQARRGRPNEPANVVLTIAELAKIRGVDPDELGARIATNAAIAFALPNRSL
jgi:TatD DNase family protein